MTIPDSFIVSAPPFAMATGGNLFSLTPLYPPSPVP